MAWMPLQSVGTNSVHASSIMNTFGVMMTQEPSGAPFLTIHKDGNALQSSFIPFARKIMGPLFLLCSQHEHK